MYRYLAVVLIPTLALACCPPRQWEGIEYIAIGSTDTTGKSHYTEIEQKVSIDSDRRMVYVQQSMLIDGVGVKQNVLQDYNTATQYILKDGSCEKMGITSMEPGCIPQNATVVIKSYMGAGNSKVTTTMYRFEAGQSIAYAVMADDGCIPMTYEATGRNENGDGFQTTVEIFSVTAGIRDTNVFRVPANCGVHRPVFVGVEVGRR